MISLLCKQTRARPLKQAGGELSENGGVAARLTFAAFISSLLVVGLLVQPGEANFMTEEGKPCICNTTFYRQCPSQSNCMEDVETTLDPDPQDYKPKRKKEHNPPPIHDDMDPDHVDIEPVFEPSLKSKSHKNSYYDWNNRDSEVPVQRHRKVYLTRRTKQDPAPTIHRFRITIPVVPPTLEPVSIPEPKPVFKYRKYTTYETKKEVQMVPVTKTVIKPVGVSPDQIIDDENIATKGQLF